MKSLITLYFIIIAELAFSTPYESYREQGGELTWLDGFSLDFLPRLEPAYKTFKHNSPLDDSYITPIEEFNNAMNDIGKSQTVINQLDQLESFKIMKGEIQEGYWSYHSFPLHKGGFSSRFTDKKFNDKTNWQERHQYFLDNPATRYLNSKDIDSLSPLEKYELFIGHDNFSISHKEWNDGKNIFNNLGFIPKWYGACHGTAPSSTLNKKPLRYFQVKAANTNQLIGFYPSDIYALLAYVWSKNGGASYTFGKRCDLHNQETSRSNCMDVDPGAFHLALTNLVGIHSIPLYIDTSKSHPVWNRPIISYQYEYYNQYSNRTTKNRQNATYKVSENIDKYKHLVGTEVVSVTGIWLKLKLLADNNPTNEKDLTEVKNNFLQNQYLYELYQDKNGHIIGGEWISYQHPDFAWFVSKDFRPYSLEDRIYESNEQLEKLEKIPSRLQELASRSAHKNVISYKVIEKLLNLSTL